MKPTIPFSPLTETELHAALAADDTILPSSGFARSVMAALGREAAAPAPIPFPWKRALPGLAAAAVVAALTVAALVAAFTHPALPGSGVSASAASALSVDWSARLVSLLRDASGSLAVWVLLSLALSVACLLFCRRLLAVE